MAKAPPLLPFATPAPSMKKGAPAQRVTRSSQTVNKPKENPYGKGAVNAPRVGRAKVDRINLK